MKLTSILILVLFSFKLGTAQTLHLYGGENHDEYLGCLNCDKYSSSSIWNEYGTYGSRYNSNSIWNQYGTYGSDYSSSSPWNTYASDPPVVVDKDGGFYGYFTVNEYKSKRATFDLALVIYKYHKEIRENVGEWYDEIFD
ncbi:hypothetical protein [Winogradskyella aquimaris]|uniref:Glycyl-tRNA synthetase subunit alpha n=1 Tax=Winogradskyella aquimaris TaxID=864074 RepID=A0ABU5ERN1_9FLAO|nr:hypothetical protein [Winogradskyella aquimaris]MDY2588200.1 hypothetical protein [Winogradskyella aquimaris]